MRIVIVGAGGQGAIVTEMVARRHGRDALVAFVDDDPALAGTDISGVRVHGPVSRIGEVPHDAVVVAIGDNHRRAAVTEVLVRGGETLISVVHPHASVAEESQVGPGSMISAGAVVVPRVRIARGVLLNTRASVDHDSDLGEFVHIGPGATLGANVHVGARSLVGLGASVISRRRIGSDAVVGAGAVVTHDVPDGVIVAGVPARVVRPRTAR